MNWLIELMIMKMMMMYSWQRTRQLLLWLSVKAQTIAWFDMLYPLCNVGNIEEEISQPSWTSLAFAKGRKSPNFHIQKAFCHSATWDVGTKQHHLGAPELQEDSGGKNENMNFCRSHWAMFQCSSTNQHTISSGKKRENKIMTLWESPVSWVFSDNFTDMLSW